MLRGSLGGLENIIVNYSSIQHLVLDFSSVFPLISGYGMLTSPTYLRTLMQTKFRCRSPIPHMPTPRCLTFKASMTETTVPISLMSTITTLPTCTPKLEVLTFQFDGNWEGRRRVTVQTDADEALTSLPHLCEAHFIVEADFSQGSLTRRIREQLPLSRAAGLLRFLLL
ncbi:hypothetical protein B0H13DRAFT_2339872 [Mycena leptocephala]|nr:hypothetical protein B0H13DRAFT_2339872 [Mycena leptocephala]